MLATDVALTGLIVSYTLTWAYARGLAPAQAITSRPFQASVGQIFSKPRIKNHHLLPHLKLNFASM